MSSRRRCGIGAVGKRPVENDSLRVIDVGNIDHAAVEAGKAAVPNEGVQIARIITFVASTCAVLGAQTGYRQSLVRPAGVVRGVGAVDEGVGMGIWVNIGAIQPHSWEESESRSAQDERSNSSSGR